MERNVHCQAPGYTVCKRLQGVIDAELDKAGIPKGRSAILTFRDPGYSVERGGYHPVEILVRASGKIDYITDFAYVGDGYCAELAKEIDFDFASGAFGHMGRDYPLNHGRELFAIWMRNFCDYVGQGVFAVSCQPL